MKAHLEATLLSNSNRENFHESAHETFTKALNEQRANAEQHSNWAPRLYITKAERGDDGMLHWGADIQFGWQDSPSYEGFKLTGSVPADSEEAVYLHRRLGYSVKPSLIKGDKEIRKMVIELSTGFDI
jgi:hypothetical protein